MSKDVIAFRRVDDAPIAFDQWSMQENRPLGVLSTARANRAATESVVGFVRCP
jgi:hypothetical protein